MKTGLRCCIFAIISTLIWNGTSQAEEKNGVSLSVVKKTLDRSDSRSGYYYSDRIDRTQGLKVVIKNVSFKPIPESELEWTILVRKYSYNYVYSYTGKEKVPPLMGSAATELVIGAAPISGWKDSSSQIKDKIEYQVVMRHSDKEIIRVASVSNFDLLAKRATPAPQTGPRAATPATPTPATPTPATPTPAVK